MPTSMAARASSRVMAGPLAMLRVPGPILRLTSPGCAASGTATPKSATTTGAPTWRASTLTAAPPGQLLEAAKAARRLGQLVERPLNLEPRGAVGRHDAVKELRENVHGTAQAV